MLILITSKIRTVQLNAMNLVREQFCPLRGEGFTLQEFHFGKKFELGVGGSGRTRPDMLKVVLGP